MQGGDTEEDVSNPLVCLEGSSDSALRQLSPGLEHQLPTCSILMSHTCFFPPLLQLSALCSDMFLVPFCSLCFGLGLQSLTSSTWAAGMLWC